MIWALHGAFGDPSDWDDVRATLAPRTLRAVDLWAGDEAPSLRDWAGAFNAHVAEMDEDPVLLGYSMGARLALHALVAEDGSPWRAAVLVSPHPGLETPDERAARRAADDAWRARFDDLAWEAFWRAWNEQPVLHSTVERPLPAKREGMRRALGAWSLAEQEDLRPRFGLVECPVLWVTGERDEKFTSLGREACRLLPRAEHFVVPGAGHRVPWEAPAAWASGVVEALG